MRTWKGGCSYFLSGGWSNRGIRKGLEFRNERRAFVFDLKGSVRLSLFEFPLFSSGERLHELSCRHNAAVAKSRSVSSEGAIVSIGVYGHSDNKCGTVVLPGMLMHAPNL